MDFSTGNKVGLGFELAAAIVVVSLIVNAFLTGKFKACAISAAVFLVAGGIGAIFTFDSAQSHAHNHAAIRALHRQGFGNIIYMDADAHKATVREGRCDLKVVVNRPDTQLITSSIGWTYGASSHGYMVYTTESQMYRLTAAAAKKIAQICSHLPPA
jgi:hypothetical protein